MKWQTLVLVEIAILIAMIGREPRWLPHIAIALSVFKLCAVAWMTLNKLEPTVELSQPIDLPQAFPPPFDLYHPTGGLPLAYYEDGCDPIASRWLFGQALLARLEEGRNEQ